MGDEHSKTILVLGVSGMLGNAIFRYFSGKPEFAVYGSARSARSLQYFPEHLRDKIIVGSDVQDFDALTKIFMLTKPNFVVNCIGIVKQLAAADDPLITLPINSILPHRLAQLSAVANARLIHISTDCVFSGKKGMYRESDYPDCYDLYGRSKLLGEVNSSEAITLRTSIVGHELGTAHGLLNWFLIQNGDVSGYTRAIFSGLPTVEVARVIHDFILPNMQLKGIYHLSADPISKYDLLKLFAWAYSKSTTITPSEEVVINRSLDSRLFRTATGYHPPSWRDLVQAMQKFG